MEYRERNTGNPRSPKSLKCSCEIKAWFPSLSFLTGGPLPRTWWCVQLPGVMERENVCAGKREKPPRAHVCVQGQSLLSLQTTGQMYTDTQGPGTLILCF